VATVELRDVRKAYGGHAAVRGVSLAVASGERVALLGPSGCGKTTTLGLIAGFLEPDAGTILLDGRPMTGVPPHRRDTAMVFQSYALFPHLTVHDNVAFGLVMRRTPKAEIAARVREALALVRLTGLDARHPRELSGGQQQRVALARALVVRPAVLLLDEPLSNLDARLRQDMRVEMVEIQRRLGITTVFVTHDQEEALAIADRVAVMRDGVLEQVDAPPALYARPRTEFVARFIGEANFLPGRVAGREGDRVVVELEGGGRAVAAGDEASPAAGARVLAMVRPERVRLVAGAAVPGRENALRATVRTVTFLGPVTRCVVVAGERALTVALGEGRPPVPGDAVDVEWSAADCRLVAPPPGRVEAP
jgi:putative spermidine/putrescine transport system ATP-binding protein